MDTPRACRPRGFHPYSTWLTAITRNTTIRSGGRTRISLSFDGEQARGTFAVADCAFDGDVLQLLAGSHSAKHQAPAAHITAADKLRGKFQALAENGQEKVDVFAGGDTSQQNDFGVAYF